MTTAHVYGLAQAGLASKTIDLVNDSIKVMLCTSVYAPNQDTHQFKSDVTNEVTGTGYTAGGQALTGKALSYSATGHTETWTAANPSFPASTITARFAVFYQDTGTSTTSRLIAYWDFGVDVASSGGAFTLTVAAGGLVALAAA